MKNIVIKARLIGLTVGLFILLFVLLLVMSFQINIWLRILVVLPMAFVSMLAGCLSAEHWLRSQKKDDDDDDWS